MSDSFNLARLQNRILDIVRWRTKLGHRKWQDEWRQVRNVSRRTYEEGFDVTDWMIGRSRSISRCYLHTAENCTNIPDDHWSESHFHRQQYKLHDNLFNIIFIIIRSFYECIAFLFSTFMFFSSLCSWSIDGETATWSRRFGCSFSSKINARGGAEKGADSAIRGEMKEGNHHAIKKFEWN